MRHLLEIEAQQIREFIDAGLPTLALRSTLRLMERASASRAPGWDEMLRDAAGVAQVLLLDVTTALRKTAGQWRARRDHLSRLQALASQGSTISMLAGDLHDLLVQHGRAPRAPRAQGHMHFLSLVYLEVQDAAMAVPWSWDTQLGETDVSMPRLDVKGERQLRAAKKALLLLAHPRERAALDAFLATDRMVVPMSSVGNLDVIEGGSAGLPTLLALIQAHFKLLPAMLTAATGSIDLTDIPTNAGTGAAADLMLRHCLDVPIQGVGFIEHKIAAALEQVTGLRRIVAPKANRAEIEGIPHLAADLDDWGVELIYVDRLGQVFGDPMLFSRPVYAPNLRLDPDFLQTELDGVVRWSKILVGTCAAVLMLYAWIIMN